MMSELCRSFVGALSELCRSFRVTPAEVAHLRETVHDADACVDSCAVPPTASRPLLRECSVHIAPPSVLFSQVRCKITICDLRLSASSLINLKQAWFLLKTVIRNYAVPSDLNWCLKMVNKADSSRKRFGASQNPKVGGSNPPPATMKLQVGSRKASDLFVCLGTLDAPTQDERYSKGRPPAA